MPHPTVPLVVAARVSPDEVSADVGPRAGIMAIRQRLDRWIKDAPENWTALSPEVQSALLAHRIQVVTTQKSKEVVTEWGVLGHLAVQQAPGRFKTGDRVELLHGWVDLGKSAPSSMATYESLPHVADGWLAIAALWHHQVYNPDCMTGLERSAAADALEVWNQRMLSHCPRIERARVWRMGLLRALCALEKNGGHPLMDLLGRLFRSDIPGWSDLSLPRPVLCELAGAALTTPVLRKKLVDWGEVFLDALHNPAEPVSPTGPSADALWQGLLGLYHGHCLRQSRQGPSSRPVAPGQDMPAKVQAIIKAWLDGGLVPQDLKEQKVGAALADLSTRAPALWASLMACRLERAVHQPGEKRQETRPRM